MLADACAMTNLQGPLLRSSEDSQFHHLDAAIGESGKLGEPVLDVRHRVVVLKISLIAEDLVEYEMARGIAIFLKKVDEILRVTLNERDQRQCGGPQLRFLARLCPHLGND